MKSIHDLLICIFMNKKHFIFTVVVREKSARQSDSVLLAAHHGVNCDVILS